MSSAGSQPGAAAKPFFCYMCERSVSLTVNPTTVPSCPICQEGFLEECDASNSPNPNLFWPDRFGSFQDPNLLFSSASIDVPQNPSSVFAARGAAPSLPDPNTYNPMDFLGNHIQTLLSGGPRIQFVIDSNPSEGGFMSRGGSNPSSVFASGGGAPALSDPNTYNPMDFLGNHIQTLLSGGPRIQFVIDSNPSEDGFMSRGGSNPSSIFASGGGAPALPDPNTYNPMDFLGNHIQTLLSGGPRIQFVTDSNPSEGGFMSRGGSNPSSVFASGGGAPALSDPNTYNPMDFLGNHIQTLLSGGPRIQFVTDSNPSEGGFMSRGGSNPSSVFASGGGAPTLPDPNTYNPMDFLSNHTQTLFSGGPRIQFVEQHNLRPVSRYELPTDDPDHERRRRGEDAGPGEQEQLGDDPMDTFYQVI